MGQSNAAVQGKGDFQPVPEGDYTLRMTRYEEKQTRAGNGVLGNATFEIVSGDHKKRLIFQNFLVEHTSEKAAQIGQDQLSKYLKAVGVEGGLEGIGEDRSKVADYLEFPFTGSVGIEEPSEYVDRTTGEKKMSKARNKVKKFAAR